MLPCFYYVTGSGSRPVQLNQLLLPSCSSTVQVKAAIRVYTATASMRLFKMLNPTSSLTTACCAPIMPTSILTGWEAKRPVPTALPCTHMTPQLSHCREDRSGALCSGMSGWGRKLVCRQVSRAVLSIYYEGGTTQQCFAQCCVQQMC